MDGYPGGTSGCSGNDILPFEATGGVMRKYIWGSISLTVLFLVLPYLNIPWSWQFHAAFQLMVVFFLLQSVLVAWVLSMAESRTSSFIIFSLGAIVLRLITSFFFLVACALMEVPDLELLVVQFLVAYLCYMSFEMIVLFSNLRANSDSN